MKFKVILITLLCVIVSICLLGCGQKITNESDEKQESMFTIVEMAYQWTIVRHEKTGVMYAVSNGSYSRGNFTLLVNPDGTPMIWEEDE